MCDSTVTILQLVRSVNQDEVTCLYVDVHVLVCGDEVQSSAGLFSVLFQLLDPAELLAGRPTDRELCIDSLRGENGPDFLSFPMFVSSLSW